MLRTFKLFAQRRGEHARHILVEPLFEHRPKHFLDAVLERLGRAGHGIIVLLVIAAAVHAPRIELEFVCRRRAAPSQAFAMPGQSLWLKLEFRLRLGLGLSTFIPFRAFYSPGEWALWRPGNRDFDQLVEAANGARDEAQMRDLSRRIQAMYKEEAPAISLFTAPNVYGMHPDLDWTPRPDLLLTMFDAGWRRR